MSQEESKKISYNVAFRYTAAARGYKGVITWSSFESKAAFDEWYTADIRAREEVVEEGVSEERCTELCRQTPQECRASAIFEEVFGNRLGSMVLTGYAPSEEIVVSADDWSRDLERSDLPREIVDVVRKLLNGIGRNVPPPAVTPRLQYLGPQFLSGGIRVGDKLYGVMVHVPYDQEQGQAFFVLVPRFPDGELLRVAELRLIPAAMTI